MTDEKPLVSLIVPCYDNEPYIGECLRSIERQELLDIEVVIVNDASPDRSGDIARSWVDEQRRKRTDGRFVYVENERNLGRGGARREGIRSSTGTHLAFLDGDDALCRGYFRHVKKVLEENGHVDLVSFNYFYMTKDLARDAVHLEPAEPCRVRYSTLLYASTPSDREVIDRHVAHGRYFLWLHVVSRAHLEAVGLSEARSYEDIDTVPNLILEAQSLYFIDEYLICYRDSPDGLVNNPTPEHIESLSAIGSKFLDRARMSSDTSQALRYFLVYFRITHHLCAMERELDGARVAFRNMHYRAFKASLVVSPLKSLRYVARLSPLKEVATYLAPELKFLRSQAGKRP